MPQFPNAPGFTETSNATIAQLLPLYMQLQERQANAPVSELERQLKSIELKGALQNAPESLAIKQDVARMQPLAMLAQIAAKGIAERQLANTMRHQLETERQAAEANRIRALRAVMPAQQGTYSFFVENGKPYRANNRAGTFEVQDESGNWTPANAPTGASRLGGSMAGGGTFTPKTLEFVARQYLTGDRQAVQGFARNSTARIALQNAIVDEAGKLGMTPEQTAAQIADFAGVIAGSRTVGQRAANINLAATEANEMIDIVRETSNTFGRTNFVPWNIALKYYESGRGTPEVSAFGASINALVNVYARAINPTGQPTISDKEHARAVINTVQSPAQVDAVLDIIQRELEIAKKAPGQVREATREALIRGRDTSKTQSGATVSNW